MTKVTHIYRFFILTFLITWILWLPSVVNHLVAPVPDILLMISMMASFTPSIVGVIYLRKSNHSDFKGVMKEKLSIHFNPHWLWIIPAIFFLGAFVSLRLAILIDPTFTTYEPRSIMTIPLVLLQMLVIGGALGEEFGWRGYAYGQMRKSLTSFSSTLILGVLWSAWHLPLFFMEGTVQSNIPMIEFFLQNTLLAFFYTWVYEQTKGNLLLMIYLHGIANTSAWLFPYWQSDVGRLIGFGILIISYSLVKDLKITSINDK